MVEGREEESPEGAIAIVGMAGRFPGARDVEEFWTLLREGREAIARLKDDELEAAGVPASRRSDPNYVKAEAVLDQMEYFDAGFFGMSPKDAAIMDPQVRQILECAWHALEHAGHIPENFPGSIGVFAGCGVNAYFWQNVLADPELRESVGFFLLRHTGNDKDFLSTRISYDLNLTGPSIGIQTACSTSLVAIHYACQSLLGWECDMALAGGVTINQPHGQGYMYLPGEILSPDGHCRSYDHRSEGTVFGSGAGLVVLRRLEDALADGDTVHAVIRGSAVNNDGSGKVSYLAPSVDGQAKVIAEAIALAGVDAESIGLVEGHGTATPIGDPIEVAALTQAFRTQTEKQGFCALGSVKSNIGHLDTAAGVASLIKVVQAIKHGEVPPTVHFHEPNPQLELPASPFFVNREVIRWPGVGGKRRAGVSSLGVGGTNAHVILEEAPAGRMSSPGRDWHLLPLSGRSRGVVEAASRNLVDFLESNPGASLADVSYTLRRGRRGFEHRRVVVCSSGEDAIDALATGQGERLVDGARAVEDRKVAFLFAGGGAQYPNMGRELYEREDAFQVEVDRCLRHFEGESDFDLRSLLFPEPGAEEKAAKELQRPSRALPALFTIQYAQARLWMSWGVEPASMIGHSMGEYTAACLAGVFSPEEALSLVALRGRLFETLPPGAMTSVNLGVEELEPFLGDDLSLAAVNAPGLSLAAGPVEAVADLERRLSEREIDTRRVRIDVAAHSSMLDPILEEFGAYVARMKLHEPERPFVSNLSGAFVAEGEVTKPDYWVRHLRHTVRFADGLSQLLSPQGPVLLEVGPGRTLATLARLHPQRAQEQAILQSLPHPDEVVDAQAFTLTTMGALWVHGVEVDWERFDQGQIRRRIPLPGYAFEREPHFVHPPARTEDASTVFRKDEPLGGREEDPTRWFFRRSWEPSPRPEPLPVEGSRVLLLADDGSTGARLAGALRTRGYGLTRVAQGAGFVEGGAEDPFQVRPGKLEDWEELFRALHRSGSLPSIVVHGWCLDYPGEGGTVDQVEARAFFAPLRLLQALESVAPGHSIRFVAATSGVFPAAGEGEGEPLHALLLGPIRVAPRELPSVRARLVDVSGTPDLQAISHEVVAASSDGVVVLGGGNRLVERFERVDLRSQSQEEVVPQEGVFLITGGLGGIGLVVARTLASQASVRLVLVGRSGLPDGAEREVWLSEHPEGDKTSRAIREVQAMEALGAEVLVMAADVTDAGQMREVIAATMARFGRLDGVVHTAGILDDGPLLGRNEEQARAVLGAKVRGTLALDEALRGAGVRPDTLVLFSSSSAVIGAPGQIDYTAANAFLDAYAEGSSGTASERTVSMAWGPWKDVGMAAELSGTEQYDRDVLGDEVAGVPLEHPLFERKVSGEGSVGFRTRLAVGRHWMLDEHRVRGGNWVLPGSAYVELVHAAFREAEGRSPRHIGDLVFLRPFGVEEGESREVEVRLRGGSGSYDVLIRGRPVGESRWTDHAQAQVTASEVGGDSSKEEAASVLIARIGAPTTDERGPHPFMEFGPRWANVAGTSTSGREALLRLSLPEEFRGDLSQVSLHPALLDTATAGAQDLIEGLDGGEGALVPVGYGLVRSHGPLVPEMLSHVTLKEVDEGSTFASFDVKIYDDAGGILAEIRDFSMMRVNEGQLGDGDDPDRPAWLENAIAPKEGADAFLRILGDPDAKHVIVSPRPISVVIEEAARAAKAAPVRKGKGRPVPQVDVRPVEEALMAHDAVAETAVLAAADVGGGVRLVAFVAFEPGEHATVSELRRFMKDRVANELVPKNFVELSSLPRGEDGRLIRNELRDPFAEVDDYVAPRTATEKAVATVWQDLLGLERVSVHDNFLDVGGHSLVGIRTIVRIEKETGVRLHANALTLQTLAQIADEIEKRGGGVSQPSTKVGESASPSEVEKSEKAVTDVGFLSRVKNAIVGK